MSATAVQPSRKTRRSTKTAAPLSTAELLERAMWEAGEVSDDAAMTTEEADRLKAALEQTDLQRLVDAPAPPETLKRVSNAPLREAFNRRRHEAAARSRRAQRRLDQTDCCTPGCDEMANSDTRSGLFCAGCSEQLSAWAAEAEIVPEPRSAPVFQEPETCEGLARRVGVSSGTTVARDLGLRVTSEGTLKDSLRVPKAVDYCLALDLDPVDVGC